MEKNSFGCRTIFSVSAVNKFVLSPFPEPKLMTNSWILYFLLLSHVLGFLSRIVAKSHLDQWYSMPVIWQIWQRMIEQITTSPKHQRMIEWAATEFFWTKLLGLVALHGAPKVKFLNPMRKTFENLILHLRQTVAELGSQVF